MVSPRERRQRELADARAARQAQRRQQAHRRRQQRLAVVAGFVAVVIAASAIAAILLTTRDDDNTVAADPAASASPAPEPSTPAANLPSSKVGPCTYTSNGDTPAKNATLPAPAATVDRSPATMVITTDAGTMTAALDADKAPCTVHALLTLAESKYFDGTSCHRQTGGAQAGISVLQCGDPTGTGSGSPGYGYANENTEGVNYDRGVLAMAHSSAPNSNGSQFFINYANPTQEGAAALAGGYTVFGHITQGLEVLDKLTKPGIEGGASDGAPVSKPKITSITVTQGG